MNDRQPRLLAWRIVRKIDLPLGLGRYGMLVLPLLATQILWINLLTDGALALGIDPADPDLMSKPPRPRSEGVGVVMAAGTLLIFHAALPGGLIEGAGKLEYGRTMAFTTLMLFQLFNAFNARLEVHSAFRGPLCNRWLWGAVSLSVALQVLVIYLPFLQDAFGTVRLNAWDWTRSIVVASSVLWVVQAAKFVTGRIRPPKPGKAALTSHLPNAPADGATPSSVGHGAATAVGGTNP